MQTHVSDRRDLLGTTGRLFPDTIHRIQHVRDQVRINPYFCIHRIRNGCLRDLYLQRSIFAGQDAARGE